MKRYRYILSGKATGEDKLSRFRLIAGNNIKPSYNGKVVIRVNIPNDVELIKYNCDSYSSTSDSRTLNELGYDILIWDSEKRKWKMHNEFKGLNPHEITL